jgi:hypothetical protein
LSSTVKPAVRVRRRLGMLMAVLALARAAPAAAATGGVTEAHQ